jgi:hypothetical protein
MRKGSEAATVGIEYREAMLRGASLAWEERWEAATAAYRLALVARPHDAAAERQLALVQTRAGSSNSQAPRPATEPAPTPIGAPPVAVGQPAEPTTNGMDAVVLGRTASAHVAELAELPRDLVRPVVEGMHAIERDQEAGRLSAAFERAYALLQLAPIFLPLHILLADLYTDTGQWQAVREKLGAVEAAYAARAIRTAEATAA